jgi:HEAT repeat protein
MKRVAAFLSAALLLLAPGCSGKKRAGQAKSHSSFAARPTARLEDGDVVIEFSAAQKTDVAVFVKDHRGRTVRHLAAGVLGDNAPAPLKAGRLDQRLVWDGRDDDGGALPAGKYSIEVALGLAPRFDRLFLNDPLAVGAVHGLAVGPGGNLYVLGGRGRVSARSRFLVLDPHGKYLRTILPRPAGLPLERVKSLGELVLENGERFPLALLPQYGGPLNQVPVVAPNGDLIFANGYMQYHAERHRFHAIERLKPQWPRRLLRLAPDGGAPQAGYLGPVLGKDFEKKTLYLALSPDGETVYISGAGHAVFKLRWGADQKPLLFLGVPDSAGKGAKGLKSPCGIAIDGKGNLYVADRGNHRVACFDPAGRLLGEIPVEWPLHLAVHPKTGAIYVIRGYRSYELVKFTGLGKATPAARLPLKSRWPVLALDARGARPVVYVGNLDRRSGREAHTHQAVTRILDMGKRFSDAGEVTRGAPARPGPLLLAADRRRGWVYGVTGNSNFRLSGNTGRIETIPLRQHPKSNNSHDMTCAADGTVAVLVPSEIGRFDPELLPVPFSCSKSFITHFKGEGRAFAGRGGFITPDGSIYRNHEPGGHGTPMRVSVVGSDGIMKDRTRVLLETGSSAGIRVDRAGNIYVLDHLKPLGKPVPDAFQGKLKIERHNPFVYHYGSVLKFGPGGGVVRELSLKAPRKRELKPGEMQFTTAEGRGDYLSQGALWSYYGVSMITPALDRGRYSPYNCMCLTPNFDVDEFARVFVPDQLRCRVVVLDTAGNFITAFGGYGNVDQRGPELSFADPRSVMVSRDAAYVGDARNNRIVEVKLEYRKRASCAVQLPALGATGTSRLGRLVLRLREEAGRLSPALDASYNWKAMERRLAARSSDASLESARAELCLTAPREMSNWPEAESRALLSHYLEDGGENLRAAVVWGLSGGRQGEAGGELLRQALKDKSEIVRVAAAYVLLDRRDPAGLAAIFRGAGSKNGDVYKLAETTILRQLLVWDALHPKARTLDTRNCLVPLYTMDRAAVLALGGLLDGTKKWYLRRAAVFLLGFSGRPEGAPALLRALRRPERDRNLNRCIAGLGLLRCRASVSDLVRYLARGHCANYGTEHYNGDEAEAYAARALVRIAEPKSVGPVIALLDSKKPEVRKLARRTLTELFVVGVAADRVLVPRSGKLIRVRVDRLPKPAELRVAWEKFWKETSNRYLWQKAGAPLQSRK